MAILNLLFNRSILIISVWCITLGATMVQADQKIEIRTIGIPPYGIQNNAGFSGIYYDTANLLAKETGYQVNNLIYPYARIINELKSGQTDMTIMFKYKELEPYVVYIAPLATLKNVVIGLKGTIFDSFDSLKGKKLAYLRGAKFSDRVDNNPEIFSVVTDDFIQGINILLARRVDGIIGPLEPILSAAKSVVHDRYIFDDPFVVSERTPWVQISRKSADRISEEKLKLKFIDLKQKHKLELIRDKYLKPLSPE